MLLKEDIEDPEKSDGICSLTFDVDEFSRLFYIHQSFLLCTQGMHENKWCFIRFFVID